MNARDQSGEGAAAVAEGCHDDPDDHQTYDHYLGTITLERWTSSE